MKTRIAAFVKGEAVLCAAAVCALITMVLVPPDGEYIGYKTDHDPRRRATSVGPYTSRQMTECLEQAVRAKRKAAFYDSYVRPLVKEGASLAVTGEELLAMVRRAIEEGEAK